MKRLISNAIACIVIAFGGVYLTSAPAYSTSALSTATGPDPIKVDKCCGCGGDCCCTCEGCSASADGCACL